MFDYHRKARSAIGVVGATREQDLNLLAGQLYFGHPASRVRTLLGSCVAVALWHPHKRIGGMCHFLLPERVREAGMPLDARFGREAFALLVDAVSKAGTQPHEYSAYLYGGADTMPDKVGVKFNVGERNIELGWGLIDQHGFTLQEVDVGDNVPRTVHLNLSTGEVHMRRGQPTTHVLPPMPSLSRPAPLPKPAAKEKTPWASKHS
jgi:chemotaxis protein CheD